jgi:hypothetical protein
MVSLKFEHLSGKSWHFDMHRATATFERPTGLIATELNSPWDSIIIYDKASGRRAHKRQGVAKFVAKGAVSATFVVATHLEGGGSGRPRRTVDKRAEATSRIEATGRQEKLAVLEKRARTAMEEASQVSSDNPDFNEMVATAGMLLTANISYISKLVSKANLNELQSMELELDEFGRGVKALPAARKVMPYLFKTYSKTTKHVETMSAAIESIEAAFDFAFAKAFLSLNGVLNLDTMRGLVQDAIEAEQRKGAEMQAAEVQQLEQHAAVIETLDQNTLLRLLRTVGVLNIGGGQQ